MKKGTGRTFRISQCLPAEPHDTRQRIRNQPAAEGIAHGKRLTRYRVAAEADGILYEVAGGCARAVLDAE